MENIEIYFESIKQVYYQILDWEEERKKRPYPLGRRITNFLLISSLFCFILSLIPIIPSLFIYIGSQFSWTILGFQLKHAMIWTYALAWLVSTLITLLLFALNVWVESNIHPVLNPLNREKEKAPQTLSAEQLTFIFVYQAYKELKIFFVSHVDQHIKKTLDSLNDLQGSKQETYIADDVDLMSLPPSIRFRSVKDSPSIMRQIFVAQEFLQTFERYSCFNIDELTKARLQALISFQSKIRVRLKKRDDLPAVLGVLENLSKFLYAFLPEHQTNMNSEELNALQTEGIKYLDKFVESVSKLIDYPAEQRLDKSKHSSKNLSFSQKIQTYYFSNILFRFVAWLLLLLATTTGLIYVASLKIANLDVNIMVSTVITASVAGATALAVIGNKSRKAIEELKSKGLQHLNNTTDEQDDM